MLEVIFLILPYLKLIKIIRNEYKDNTGYDVFYDVIKNLLEQTEKDDLIKALSVMTHQDIEFSKTYTSQDIILIIPAFIEYNDIIETYYLLRQLGAFE